MFKKIAAISTILILMFCINLFAERDSGLELTIKKPDMSPLEYHPLSYTQYVWQEGSWHWAGTISTHTTQNGVVEAGAYTPLVKIVISLTWDNHEYSKTYISPENTQLTETWVLVQHENN